MPSLTAPKFVTRFAPRGKAAVVASWVMTSLLFSAPSIAATAPSELPLFQASDLEYAGGFKFQLGINGASEIAYAEGPIAIGADGITLFAVGHTYQQAIAEFRIPELVKSSNPGDFKRAPFVQSFSKVINRAPTGNPQGVDRIGGMGYVGGQLLVSGYMYYDAGGGVSHTTLALKNAADLAGSGVSGFHSFSAAAHATGWITPIPSEWQSRLGGTYIAGDGAGKPIITRNSVGPSAFAFDPTSPWLANASPSYIALTPLLDFPFDYALGSSNLNVNIDDYLYNRTGNNDLWTHVSSAEIGFIIPGTRTYLTFGNTGGIDSGLGYKITQDTGFTCYGHCPYKASDMHNFYWAWDVNDLVKVKNGEMARYDVRPYAYGKINTPLGFREMIGGAFDPATNMVYLNFKNGEAGGLPAVLAYKINIGGGGSATAAPPAPPSQIDVKKP